MFLIILIFWKIHSLVLLQVGIHAETHSGTVAVIIEALTCGNFITQFVVILALKTYGIQHLNIYHLVGHL
jgi:hypothetical protein